MRFPLIPPSSLGASMISAHAVFSDAALGGGKTTRLASMSDDLAPRIAALRRSAVFGALEEPFLARLAGSMSEVTFPAGHVLIEPRAAGSGMFVIDDGRVTVQPRDAAPVELGPGEVVGELALLTEDGTRTARVQALTEVRCLTLDRATLQGALDDEPKLAIALLRAAVERLASQILS
jgi:CRP-like cAMP-binding protein